jgi:diacylglycerol O-acyltransferase
MKCAREEATDMPQLLENDSLSWGDALFLYLERPGMPLNIASVSDFEGDIGLHQCLQFVASKLPLLPRYLQRVVTPPFNIGLPTWEYDAGFDIRNHVREVVLKRGTDADLKAAAAKILSVPMDRSRPLWDLTLFRGLKGERTAVLARLHHCLADGIAGVSLMNVLMDPEPVVHPPASQPKFRPPARRDPPTMLVDGLLNFYSALVQRVLRMQADIVDIARKTLGGAEQMPANAWDRFLPALSAPIERLPFNLICQGPQKIAWAAIPMAEIHAVREVLGAKVNDVVVAVVAGALRRYAELRGVEVRGRKLRIVVPVNMRGNGGSGGLGNRLSFIPVTVPLDQRNEKKLLKAVHEHMQFLKSAHAAEIVGLAGTLLGTIPPALQALAGPLASQLPITLCNLICTNVPGPEIPLYLMGHKMLRWYPYVPIGGEMGINCALLSYNGTAYFGFSGDVHAAPGLQRLDQFVRTSFAELRKAAGVKTARRTTRKAVASAAKSSPEKKEFAAAAGE